MRYEVKDAKGKWHASYAKTILGFAPKDSLKWAKQTAKHINGIVYEVIVPSNPQYPTKTIEVFNYSYKKYKSPSQDKKNNNASSNKKDIKDKK
jgi:hypothetical protein